MNCAVVVEDVVLFLLLWMRGDVVFVVVEEVVLFLLLWMRGGVVFVVDERWCCFCCCG